MREIIEGYKKRITTVNEQMIFRNSQTKKIENRYQEKDFRLCYDKRVMKKTETGIETFPYGYIKSEIKKETYPHTWKPSSKKNITRMLGGLKDNNLSKKKKNITRMDDESIMYDFNECMLHQ